jgi:hypothetical protein
MRDEANFLKPTIDVEVRHNGENIDMGVFAPNNMLGLEKAEQMVLGFRECWV